MSVLCDVVHASGSRARREDRAAPAEGEAEYQHDRAERDADIAYYQGRLQQIERARVRLNEEENEIHGRLQGLTLAALDEPTPWRDPEW